MITPGADEPAHPILADTKYGLSFLIDIPEELWTAYYAALGRLMHEFAKAEENMSIHLLEEASKLTMGRSDVLKSIAISMRAASLKDAIKRILRIVNSPQQTIHEVEQIFNQFGQIQFLRNLLAHHSAVPNMENKAGYFVVSNISEVRERTSEEIVYFKIDTLDNRLLT